MSPAPLSDWLFSLTGKEEDRGKREINRDSPSRIVDLLRENLE